MQTETGFTVTTEFKVIKYPFSLIFFSIYCTYLRTLNFVFIFSWSVVLMVRSFLCVLFKQARKHATYAVNKAFSAKYLLLTNGLVSAGMSGSADSLVQKVCRRHNNKSTPSETSKV